MRQKLRQMQQQQNQATAAGPLTTLEREGDIVPIPLAAVQIWKGAAAAVVVGTGLGTPLVPTNDQHQFVGVWAESYNNTGGTGVAGSTGYYTKILRRKCWAWSQTGTTITNAYIGRNVYFSDDNTVTLTAGTTFAGTISSVDLAGNVWVDIEQAVRTAPESGKDLFQLSGSTDAIPPHEDAKYVVVTAGVDAMTLAAPTAGIDDGTTIVVTSGTANAHTITATGLFEDGSTTVNVATFAAHPGASITLTAYNGKWNVISSNAVTMS